MPGATCGSRTRRRAVLSPNGIQVDSPLHLQWMSFERIGSQGRSACRVSGAASAPSARRTSASPTRISDQPCGAAYARCAGGRSGRGCIGHDGSTIAEGPMADARPTISTHVLDLAAGALRRASASRSSTSPTTARRSSSADLRPMTTVASATSSTVASSAKATTSSPSTSAATPTIPMPSSRAPPRVAHHRYGAFVPRAAAAQPVRDEHLPRQLIAR